MAFDFSLFRSDADRPVLDEEFVDFMVRSGAMDAALHYEKFWRYYRNDMQAIDMVDGNVEASQTARPYRQAQEYGLPARITGVNTSFYGGVMVGRSAANVQRKEVVIENDIAWRVDTLVDFLFGKPVTIRSKAADPEKAKQIQRILNTVFDANGAMVFFQELALLGSVYGFVDVIVRIGKDLLAAKKQSSFDDVLQAARSIMLETIEAPRALPILDPQNYKRMHYYVQHLWVEHNQLDLQGSPVQTWTPGGYRGTRQKQSHLVEVIGPNAWQRYSDDVLTDEGVNVLGELPVVHIQNMALPMHYEGQSEVEPLIPLQDELNTRLSDRANRITFQSFKMYLGKGIEGFEDRVVAPGRMWSTDNTEASIDVFGGDDACPNEDIHITQVREAMEKASGVASVAAGILKGRIGNLTSAVALKVTLMGVLSRTERKRRCYGKGIAELCRLILLSLDKTGVFATTEQERRVEIQWSSPLPENMTEKLQEASIKKAIGVPGDRILEELGYGEGI